MCGFYAVVPVALRQRAFHICSPIFRGIAWAIKMNSGLLPHPLTLILKISLKEHIPVLTKKKKQSNNNKKICMKYLTSGGGGGPAHDIMCWVAFPLQTAALLREWNFLGRLCRGTTGSWHSSGGHLVWSGFYLQGRKKSLVLQELPVPDWAHACISKALSREYILI